MRQKVNIPALGKFFFLLLLFVIVASWIFYLPYKIVRQNTIDSLNAQQRLLARQASVGIEEFFGSYGKLLDHLAVHQGIIRFNDEGKVVLDEFFQANQATVSAVTRVDATGHILYTVPFQAGAIGLDISFQEHNRLLAETHEPVVSSVFKAVQGYDTVAYAVPVFDQGEYAGSLSILIPFAVVAEKYLANIVLGKNGYAWMISKEGVELYCPVPGHVGRTVFEMSSTLPDVIKMAEKMMAGEEGQTTYRYDWMKVNSRAEVVKHAVYHPVHLPHNLWSIVVETPEKQALAPLHDFGKWWMLIFVGFVGVLLVYSYFVFRSRLKVEEQRERAESEKRVTENQNFFGKFINAAHVPIAMVNINGTIEFLNEKCVELYGYTLADVPTMDAWFNKAYPEQSLNRLIAKSWQRRLDDARNQKFLVSPEKRSIVCKDGSIKDVEFAYTLIEDRVVITLNDKTEENRVEKEKKELEQRTAKAKKMEVLGLLAGGVAHDLNNILSGVVSYPELLLMQLPPESKMRSALELIHQSGLQAAAVVADLLTVARGVVSVKKTENLNTLILEYMQSSVCKAIAASHPDISCVQDLAPGLANISCSAVHVKKCLMNLMTNGAEAIEGEGQVVVSTRHEAVAQEKAAALSVPPGEYVVLSVRDTGGGIADQDKEHIFEPFYTKKEMGRSGSGLGLTVVWNTMQDHDGTVAVTSSDMGTTFALYFPVSTEELPGQEEHGDPKELRGFGQKILVVDDQAYQRDIACQILHHLNYECYAVSSGEEALEYLTENNVDLVVLDMIMGSGMDGSQTYAALVKQNPGLKAIIASGFSENENVKEAQRLGAGDFIKKPYSMRQLGLALQKALAVEIRK
ncbi:MAG: response regulator [Proteobacteria bacterium]|nr:response regulator [Pseudomonadota bacterium]MBU1640821.1 response regulator [Pseudomonadota bacterium]